MIISLRHWTAIIEPNGYADPLLHYANHDGRKLLARGPAPSKLGPDLEAEVSFHPERSKQASKLSCDGFAKLWSDEGEPHAFDVTLDLDKSLWEDLWAKAMIPTAYGALLFTILVPEENMPHNEDVPIIDPSISFYVAHPKP